MQPLSWIASTPEGEHLGALAARSVEVVLSSSPWWTAPLEPVRWLMALSGTAPHTFYSFAAFAIVSPIFGCAWARRRADQPFSRTATSGAIVLMLTFVGAFFGIRTVDTWLPGGLEWRVPDAAPFRLANLHAHSQLSGGALMPEDVVRWHYQRGFRVVALSDSNGMRGVERAQQYIDRTGLPMLLVPAQEYRGRTHLLMYNIREAVVPAEYDVKQAIARARAQGGLVLVAHPWTSDRTPDELVAWGARGFEITNGNVVASEETRAIADRDRLAVVGNLDFRQGNRPLTATVLPAWADTPARVQQALASGACAALYFVNEVDSGGFNFWRQLGRTLVVLLRERLPLLLGGLAFWTLLLVGMRRWRPAVVLPAIPSTTALVLISALSLATAVLTVWCMWWEFRRGWLPRSEWSLYAWVITCPACWAILWSRPRS